MIKQAKTAIVGVDVGGTKMEVAVYPFVNGKIVPEPIAKFRVPVEEKGEEGLRNAMNDVYARSQEAVPDHDIVGVGLGSPGRPVAKEGASEHAFVAAPGSAANLEKFKGEFDNVDIQPIFQADIDVPVRMNNDAIVQMLAMLDDVLKSEGKTKFYGEKVAYIGMGTGEGGGFAEVDRQGNVTVHTDGHVYDILLAMPGDIEKIHAFNLEQEVKLANALVTVGPEAANDPMLKKLQFDESGTFVRSEDLLSGTALKKLTGRGGEEINSAEAAEEVRPMLELMGRALAEQVERIHTGAFHKLNPEADWPERDLDQVRGTSHFLMGGGVANNPFVMGIIEEAAQARLAEKGIEGIEFHAVPDKATTLAAAHVVVPELLEQSRSHGRA